MPQTVLITGASSGIGRATVQLFVQQGWNVVATMRDPVATAEFPPMERLLVTALDVTDRASIQAARDRAIARFSRIDVVVNNAGYGLLGALETATPQQIEAQFQTNVLGLFNMTQAFLPHFRANRRGRFINVSSMLGRLTLPFFSVYAATKWAVEGFSEALQYELAPFNIGVKLIEPGTINTDFYTRSLRIGSQAGVAAYADAFATVLTNIQHRGARGTAPAAVARAILVAATDRSTRLRYVPDSTARFLIILHQLLPLGVFRRIIRQTVGG